MEVKTKEAAQKAVKRGAELSALLGAAIANRNRKALAVEKSYGSLISQLAAEIGAIEAQLADWARDNREEFAGKQSLEFPCGVLAFQAGKRSCEPLKRWTWERVIQKARKLLLWRKYLRIKFEIDRRRILSDTAGQKPRLSPDRLKTIGLGIVTGEETFSVEFRIKTPLKKKT
jgi:phage host-nuclease inhibitor protein Gam